MKTTIYAVLDLYEEGDFKALPQDGYRFTTVRLRDPEMSINVWNAATARKLADALNEAADRLDAKMAVPA